MKKFILAAVAISMAGCANNFNTYPSTILLVAKEAKKPKPGDPKLPLKAAASACPDYVIPALGKTPELPMKELEAAGGDLRLVETIERQHIDDLRSYISTLKRDLNKTHLTYIAGCIVATKK